MSLTPTSRVVIDSWAWLELFRGSNPGKKVEDELSKDTLGYTTATTLAEVVSVFGRRKMPAEAAAASIQSHARVLVPSTEDAVEAGIIHSTLKAKVPNFSLADAFVLQAARKLGAKVLTGDPDFRGLKEAELLEG